MSRIPTIEIVRDDLDLTVAVEGTYVTEESGHHGDFDECVEEITAAVCTTVGHFKEGQVITLTPEETLEAEKVIIEDEKKQQEERILERRIEASEDWD